MKHQRWRAQRTSRLLCHANRFNDVNKNNHTSQILKMFIRHSLFSQFCCVWLLWWCKLALTCYQLTLLHAKVLGMQLWLSPTSALLSYFHSLWEPYKVENRSVRCETKLQCHNNSPRICISRLNLLSKPGLAVAS